MNKPHSAIITKIGLAVCFLLGLVFVFLGIRGGNQASGAVSGSGDGAGAVSALSGDASAAWYTLAVDWAALDEAEQQALSGALLPLVQDSWESRKAGAGEEAAAFVAEAGDRGAERLFKLLYLTELMDGPKLTAAVRRTVAALPGESRSEEHTSELQSRI